VRQTDVDPYAICRHVAHYRARNGYALRTGQLGCDAEYEEKLVTNGVIKRLPIYEGGPEVEVVLTDKGRRMASEERPRRRR
jgi:hypothetical protein